MITRGAPEVPQTLVYESTPSRSSSGPRVFRVSSNMAPLRKASKAIQPMAGGRGRAPMASCVNHKSIMGMITIWERA